MVLMMVLLMMMDDDVSRSYLTEISIFFHMHVWTFSTSFAISELALASLVAIIIASPNLNRHSCLACATKKNPPT